MPLPTIRIKVNHPAIFFRSKSKIGYKRLSICMDRFNKLGVSWPQTPEGSDGIKIWAGRIQPCNVTKAPIKKFSSITRYMSSKRMSENMEVFRVEATCSLADGFD